VTKMGCLWYGLAIAAICVALSALMAWLLQALWNWLIPDLFNGPMVTYWQAFGIMLLLSFVKGAVTVNNRRAGE
jgi:hypothetical protein